MREEFIHFLWRYKKLPIKELSTEEGGKIEVREWGYHNHNSGPDFKECQVSIDDTIWAGHVEMHLRSSDWYRHRHDEDKSYNNVILHVVWEHDREVYAQEMRLPVLELKGKIPGKWYQNYEALMQQNHKIACHRTLSEFDNFKWQMWLQRLATERMEEKCGEINQWLQQSNNDLEYVLNVFWAQSFGMKINKEPMRTMARDFPYHLIEKLGREPVKIHALVLGLSGWLAETDDNPYWIKLQSEYKYLKQLHELTPVLQKENWSMARLRPGNFPPIRLAQWAETLINFYPFYPKLKSLTAKNWEEKLLGIRLPDYWQTHYKPGVVTNEKKKKMGHVFTNNLLINTLAPMRFVMGQREGSEHAKDAALELLEFIKPESNKITKIYEKLDKKPINALESQAQIQLYKYFCQPKKCLSCQVGVSLLKK